MGMCGAVDVSRQPPPCRHRQPAPALHAAAEVLRERRVASTTTAHCWINCPLPNSLAPTPPTHTPTQPPPHRTQPLLVAALQTLATQCVGAGRPVGVIFQRAVLFLTLHCLPITAMFVAVPHLLAALGQPADVCALVRAYLLALLPNLWIDAVARWAAWHVSQGGQGRVEARLAIAVPSCGAAL